MNVFNKLAATIASATLVLSFATVSAASALTVSCAGVPSTTSVTWTASSDGGIAPIAFLWSNGSILSSQTLTVTPGTYTISVQGTDASSTVSASSTCAATVAQPTPPTTGTDVSAQVQNLLNQINALKAQLLALLQQHGSQSANQGGDVNPLASSTPSGACGFMRDLRQGDKGDDVKQLQQSLSNDPSILPPSLATGFFGRRTAEALMKFQSKFGISSSTTGFFGPKTRGFMKEHCGERRDDNKNRPNMMGSSTMPFMMGGNEHGMMGGQGEGGNRGNGGRGGRDN
jgi:hypothetical protein